jgi:hypothetical protein
MFKLKKDTCIFIKVFIVIVVVPIGLNYLIPIENKYFSVIGNESTWFSFWSVYSGAVISGLITLFVLFKTLKQNQTNYINQKANSERLNREQKNFQLNLFEYQEKRRWLMELKSKLERDTEILDFSNIVSLTHQISIVNSNIELTDKIHLLGKRIKGTGISLKILYTDGFNSKESKAYEANCNELISVLIRIIDGFSSYLVQLEVSAETKERINNAKDIESLEVSDLAFSREKGLSDLSAKRREIINKVEEGKPEFELKNEKLLSSMMELIKFEEEQIKEDRSLRTSRRR